MGTLACGSAVASSTSVAEDETVLFEILKECKQKGDKAEFLRELEKRFPELTVLKGGCQIAPGQFESNGQHVVYYQCAGSFAALVCYLAICTDKEKNKADVQRLLKLIKPEDFETVLDFCDHIKSSGASPKLMMVMLALDRLGKSYKVHSTVKKHAAEYDKVETSSEDHFETLQTVLDDPLLYKALAPSFCKKLDDSEREAVRAMFASDFRLLQFLQGECAPASFTSFSMASPTTKHYLDQGVIHSYLYHEVFMGTSRQANENNLPAKPVVPLVKRSNKAIDLITKAVGEINAKGAGKPDEDTTKASKRVQMYLKVCLEISKEERTYQCLPPDFHDSRDDLKLAAMRILMMTRYLYENMSHVVRWLRQWPQLVEELSGTGRAQKHQIMLFYGPDMVQEALGVNDVVKACAEANRKDVDGMDMDNVMRALVILFSKARSAVDLRATAATTTVDAANHGDVLELCVVNLSVQLNARGAMRRRDRSNPREFNGGRLRVLDRLVERLEVHTNADVTQGTIDVAPLRLQDMWQLEDIIAELEMVHSKADAIFGLNMPKLLTISYALKASFAMNTANDMQVLDQLVKEDIRIWEVLLKLLQVMSSMDFTDSCSTECRNICAVLVTLSFSQPVLEAMKAANLVPVVKGLQEKLNKVHLAGQTLPAAESHHVNVSQMFSVGDQKLEVFSSTDMETITLAANLIRIGDPEGVYTQPNEEDNNPKARLQRGNTVVAIVVPRAAPKHVMLSYSWGPREEDGSYKYQKIMLELREQLIAKGINVWMDVYDMPDNVFDGMAYAIDNAYMVIIGASSHYAKSGNCRMECEYASKRRMRMCWLMMEEHLKAEGWFGLIMGQALYKDVFDETKVDDDTLAFVTNQHKEAIKSVPAVELYKQPSPNGSARPTHVVDSTQEEKLRAPPVSNSNTTRSLFSSQGIMEKEDLLFKLGEKLEKMTELQSAIAHTLQLNTHNLETMRTRTCSIA